MRAKRLNRVSAVLYCRANCHWNATTFRGRQKCTKWYQRSAMRQGSKGPTSKTNSTCMSLQGSFCTFSTARPWSSQPTTTTIWTSSSCPPSSCQSIRTIHLLLRKLPLSLTPECRWLSTPKKLNFMCLVLKASGSFRPKPTSLTSSKSLPFQALISPPSKASIKPSEEVAPIL